MAPWTETIANRKKKKRPPTAEDPTARNAPSTNGHAEGPITLETTDDSPFPDDPDKVAFHGLAGDLVAAIDPHTEASRVAILVQALVAYGSVIGRNAHFRVERTKHHLNLFAVIVGTTAKGRKGTSWDRVRNIYSEVDKAWLDKRIVGGMSSGEGLIWEVRDAVVKIEKIDDKGRTPGFQEVEIDPGVEDKRLLIVESEFAGALKQADRQGNILSMVCRQAWESGTIRTLSKNSPAKSTDAHISIIGHVTADELRRYLSSTEAASGFGNRFLWLAVRRSKLLPEGGLEPDIGPMQKRFAKAVDFARCVYEMPRDEEARELWHAVYPKLSAEVPGLVGALIARAEAQTMRLACIYALLDESHQVEAVHLKAALALWEYCHRSTRFIFGHSTGDSVADSILDALRKNKEGLSRQEISSLFSRHQTEERLQSAMLVLERAELAHRQILKTGGRPKEVWTYGPAK